LRDSGGGGGGGDESKVLIANRSNKGADGRRCSSSDSSVSRERGAASFRRTATAIGQFPFYFFFFDISD
jgi:hypothetical protein